MSVYLVTSLLLLPVIFINKIIKYVFEIISQKAQNDNGVGQGDESMINLKVIEKIKLGKHKTKRRRKTTFDLQWDKTD